MSRPDWNAVRPIPDRIRAYIAKGGPYSVLEVCEALQVSNMHARTVLRGMARRGEAMETYAKRDRHFVSVYAAPARAGIGGRVPPKR